MGENTPFFHRAARLATLRARFFVPGHKGNPAAIPPFAGILPYDLTEIDGADDLSHPSGPLAASEANMSRAYGSGATLYSAGGATACIEAMLHLFIKPGTRVLMARGCHLSALRALVFTGAQPLWLPVRAGRLTPETLAPALAQNPGAPVYLTSPDYYGRMSDIAALVALCGKYKSPLLVDNAHGAHLHFLQPDRHPLALGATATADSAHKTLPCLTGAALLHLRDKTLAPKARQALNLYSSTSPSYLILESLDLCAGLLLNAPPNFMQAAQRLAAAAQDAAPLCLPVDDPLKLCLSASLPDRPPEALPKALKEAGILPEFYDGQRLVLMAGPYNSPEDFHLLAEVLARFPQRAALPVAEEMYPLPQVVCSPREAFFSEKEFLPVAQTMGRVAAGIDAPCPPGVPVVAPGERIGEVEARRMAAGGILEVDVLK